MIPKQASVDFWVKYSLDRLSTHLFNSYSIVSLFLGPLYVLGLRSQRLAGGWFLSLHTAPLLTAENPLARGHKCVALYHPLPAYPLQLQFLYRGSQERDTHCAYNICPYALLHWPCVCMSVYVFSSISHVSVQLQGISKNMHDITELSWNV